MTIYAETEEDRAVKERLRESISRQFDGWVTKYRHAAEKGVAYSDRQKDICWAAKRQKFKISHVREAARIWRKKGAYRLVFEEMQIMGLE